MAYPPLPPFQRGDPFGPVAHNSLLQRQDELYWLLGAEHDPYTGEHNTPHVARTLGHVSWNGAVYGISGTGFNTYMKVVANPAVGTVTLTLESNKFSFTHGMLEVQPASDTGGGDGNVWFSSALWETDTSIKIFLKKNTATVDVQQALAAADGNFFLGVRSLPLDTSAARAIATRRRRGDGLRIGDWNTFVEDQGIDRAASLVGHTSGGLHDTREVSKAWGYARYDSANSRYTWAAHQGLGAGIVRQSTGVVRIYLANCVPAIVSPVQAFARAMSATTGTDHTGLRKAMVPVSLCGATTVDVYLYESYVSGGEYRWRRVDGDFAVRVHGA